MEPFFCEYFLQSRMHPQGGGLAESEVNQKVVTDRLFTNPLEESSPDRRTYGKAMPRKPYVRK